MSELRQCRVVLFFFSALLRACLAATTFFGLGETRFDVLANTKTRARGSRDNLRSDRHDPHNLRRLCRPAGRRRPRALRELSTREFEEAKSLAREKIPAIIDRHGPDHTLTLEVRTWYARALFLEGEDLSEAESVLEDVWRRSKRVLGDSYPDTERARKFLEEVRSARD